MNTEIKLGNKTNYPKIFLCYWANMGYSNEYDEIIENRNNFIEQYNIKKIANHKLKFIQNFKLDLYRSANSSLFDHLEIYQDNNDKYVILNSPYGEQNEKLINADWEVINPLYSQSATTYIKILNKADMNKMGFVSKNISEYKF